MKLLRMLPTVILYNVTCDCMYFGDTHNFLIPDSRVLSVLCTELYCFVEARQGRMGNGSGGDGIRIGHR